MQSPCYAPHLAYTSSAWLAAQGRSQAHGQLTMHLQNAEGRISHCLGQLHQLTALLCQLSLCQQQANSPCVSNSTSMPVCMEVLAMCSYSGAAQGPSGQLKMNSLFVGCMQVYNTSQQGEALVMQYHVEELPAVFIVDPITGAKLWQKSGFLSPDAFTEELVPFLDVGGYSPTTACVLIGLGSCCICGC